MPRTIRNTFASAAPAAGSQRARMQSFHDAGRQRQAAARAGTTAARRPAPSPASPNIRPPGTGGIKPAPTPDGTGGAGPGPSPTPTAGGPQFTPGGGGRGRIGGMLSSMVGRISDRMGGGRGDGPGRGDPRGGGPGGGGTNMYAGGSPTFDESAGGGSFDEAGKYTPGSPLPGFDPNAGSTGGASGGGVVGGGAAAPGAQPFGRGSPGWDENAFQQSGQDYGQWEAQRDAQEAAHPGSTVGAIPPGGPNVVNAADPNAGAPDSTGGPQAGNNPATIPQDVRAGLPDVDGTIDPSEFAAGDPTQSEVAQLAPPTDIDAATIGEYTPYEEVLGSVDDESTVEGRMEGLLSKTSDYMQRAESKANAFSNRRGLLNSSMAAGAAHGAAIDAALPIAQQDAAAFLEQQFRNQGYSNEAAKHLADASISRENLEAGLEQDTNRFNQTNLLENERLNQAAENASNMAMAAETNKNNFATLSADLQSQLAQIDNELAMNLEQLASTFDIMQNLDSVNGSIYQQMVAEIGQILTNEDKVEVAQAKINNLLAAAGIEFAFSNGQEMGGSPVGGGGGTGPGPGGGNTGDSSQDTIGGIGQGGGRDDSNAEDNRAGAGSTGSSATIGGGTSIPAGIVAGLAAAIPGAGLLASTYNKVLDAYREDTLSPEMKADIAELATQLGMTEKALMNMKMDDLKALTHKTLAEMAPTVDIDPFDVNPKDESDKGRATDGRNTKSGRAKATGPKSGVAGPGRAGGSGGRGGSDRDGRDTDSGRESASGPGSGRAGPGRAGGSGGRGGSTGRDSSCFIAGTEVIMENGTTKAIEDVEIGDVLIGWNGDNTVVEFDRPKLGDRRLYSINGGQFFVTSEHPFYTQSGWAAIEPEATARENPELAEEVGTLTIGDRIQLADGGRALVREIEDHSFDPDTQLYNFKLDGDNTYYANDMLVHNKAGDGGGSGGGGGGECFIAGTTIVLEDGESIAIEDVKVGDRLQGLNGDINTVEAFGQPYLGDRDLYSINGGEYFVTVEHPFYTSEGWKSISPDALAKENSELEVGELVIGDKIERSDGSHEKIITIQFKPAPADTPLFNFRMSGNRSYYANGYLVHNK